MHNSVLVPGISERSAYVTLPKNAVIRGAKLEVVLTVFYEFLYKKEGVVRLSPLNLALHFCTNIKIDVHLCT
jgi:hypothetical protein